MFTPGIKQIAKALDATETGVIGCQTGFVITLGIGPLVRCSFLLPVARAADFESDSGTDLRDLWKKTSLLDMLQHFHPTTDTYCFKPKLACPNNLPNPRWFFWQYVLLFKSSPYLTLSRRFYC